MSRVSHHFPHPCKRTPGRKRLRPGVAATGVSPVARCAYFTVTAQLAAGFLQVAVP